MSDGASELMGWWAKSGKWTGDTLEIQENEKLHKANFYTPPTPNPGKRSFLAPQAPKLFLVWLLDQYSNLVQINPGKIVKKSHFIEKVGHLTLDAAIWAGSISDVRIRRVLVRLEAEK